MDKQYGQIRDESFKKIIFTLRNGIENMKASITTKYSLLRVIDSHINDYLKTPELYCQNRRNALELKGLCRYVDQGINDRKNFIDIGLLSEKRELRNARLQLMKIDPKI